MDSQATSPDLRRHETELVRSLVGLGSDHPIHYEDEGWDSRVYVVNRGEVVFKFPRSAAVQTRFAQEIEILHRLEGRSSRVAVPVVRWVGPDVSYLGYQGIVGRQLARIVPRLPVDDRARIGADLGAFLIELHGITLPDARIITVEDEIEEFVRKYTAAGSVIADEFIAEDRRLLDRFFTATLPETMRALGSDPRLCHADLGPYNLVLGDDGCIGVIDFGDLGVVDRSKDFIGLDDAVMLASALDTYDGPDHLHEKVTIRALALPVLDLPFYLSKGDASRVAGCVDRLRRTLLA